MSAEPTVSGHVRKRWLDRSDAPHLEPAVLWCRGERVPPGEFGADEARYIPTADVIVLRRGASLATALEADCHEERAAAAAQERGRP